MALRLGFYCHDYFVSCNGSSGHLSKFNGGHPDVIARHSLWNLWQTESTEPDFLRALRLSLSVITLSLALVISNWSSTVPHPTDDIVISEEDGAPSSAVPILAAC
jgi:hypothetical protein